MTPPDNFDIRYSVLEDYEPMKQWFDQPGETDRFFFEGEEVEPALKNWIGFAKYKASLTGLLDGVPCGVGTLFLMPYLKVAHHCSLYLIVDPEHRRKGIGTSLVRNLIHLAKTRFRLEGIHVEVYEPSPLLPILLKQNFEIYARQENFVKVNGMGHARLILGQYF